MSFVKVAVVATAVVASSATAASGQEPVHQNFPFGQAPTISSEKFGSLDGTEVDRYTLKVKGGIEVKILNYGGIIQEIKQPDRFGKTADVVLGFKTLNEYVTENSPAAGGGVYFGALIGRYGNRIAKGQFTLDGQAYQLPINNGVNSLHGGTVGFNQKIWSASTSSDKDSVSLVLKYLSKDGEEGYPGNLSTTVTYRLDRENHLSVNYKATTDKPTVVNLTNHSYWNLAGESSGDVYGQKLTINANRYNPTDTTQIPTGQLAPVKGTAFDFTKPTAIGEHLYDNDPQLILAHGFDHNWILNRSGSGLSFAAGATDPTSGRSLAIYTTEPGVQFYSSNYIVGNLVGIGGKVYRQGAGFALETQHFPDSPNEPSFPSTVLRPGQVYDTTTVFALSA